MSCRSAATDFNSAWLQRLERRHLPQALRRIRVMRPSGASADRIARRSTAGSWSSALVKRRPRMPVARAPRTPCLRERSSRRQAAASCCRLRYRTAPACRRAAPSRPRTSDRPRPVPGLERLFVQPNEALDALRRALPRNARRRCRRPRQTPSSPLDALSAPTIRRSAAPAEYLMALSRRLKIACPIKLAVAAALAMPGSMSRASASARPLRPPARRARRTSRDDLRRQIDRATSRRATEPASTREIIRIALKVRISWSDSPIDPLQRAAR